MKSISDRSCSAAQARSSPSGGHEGRRSAGKTAFGVDQLSGSGLRAVALGLDPGPEQRRQHHRRGRPGVDVARPPCRVSARSYGVRDGGDRAGRHDVAGRPDRRLCTAITWVTRRKHREKMAITREEQDRSPSLAKPGRGGAGRPAGRARSLPVTLSTRKGDIVVDADDIRARVHLQGMSKSARLQDRWVTAATPGLDDDRRPRDHERGRGQAPGVDANGAHRLLGDGAASIRRSWAPADRAPARRWNRRAGRSTDLDCGGDEAFAAQALAVNKDLGWDPAIVTSTAAPFRSATRSALSARVLRRSCRRWPPQRQGPPRFIGGGIGIAMTVEL